MRDLLLGMGVCFGAGLALLGIGFGLPSEVLFAAVLFTVLLPCAGAGLVLWFGPRPESQG